MHEYYAKNRKKLRKAANGLVKPVAKELEELTGKPYAAAFEEIWQHYEEHMLERFPYIGGDSVSGTSNLTGAFTFVSMGEVLKRYGASMEEIGCLMTQAYERRFSSTPGFVGVLLRRLGKHAGLLNRVFMKKDAKNAANAAQNPGSFETKTQVPPEEGYDFSYYNLVCPLSNFARANGYEGYMPYLCNLDYVMFGALGVPLFREHTCFEDGDYCDFKLKLGAEPLPWWPPVFAQENDYK